MSCIRKRCQSRQVIHPVQTGFLRNRIQSTQEQIDGIWFPRSQAFRKLSSDEACNRRGPQVGIVSHRIQLDVGLYVLCKLHWNEISTACPIHVPVLGLEIPVSPASPENAISVCLLSSLVLSSEAFSIVAPLMAAFEAATRVKSFPVIPSKTSLCYISISSRYREVTTHMLSAL